MNQRNLEGFKYCFVVALVASVTKLGNSLDFGQLFKAFSNN